VAPGADLRQGVADLSTLANADLAELWRTVTNADEARAALQDILPALCETYGSASATLAADWYDTLREDMNIDGRFSAITADLGDQGGDVLARWGIGPLFGPEPDWAAAMVLIEGGLQRRIANGARDTITGSSYADPKALGWQRVGVGACAKFCQMLIDRGAVYSEGTARFASHDHCHCHAIPAFGGRPLPVKPYTPSVHDSTPAQKAGTSTRKTNVPVSDVDRLASLRGRLRAAQAAPGNNTIDIANLKRLIAGLGG